MPDAPSAAECRAALLACFRRSGYARVADLARRKGEGCDGYKKGYEVRLVLESKAEAERMRRCAEVAGFRPGRTYMKHSRIVLPLYGREVLEWFDKHRAVP